MEKSDPPRWAGSQEPRRRSRRPWLLVGGCLLLVLLAVLLPRPEENAARRQDSASARPEAAVADKARAARLPRLHGGSTSATAPPAAEVVAAKLSQFAGNRHALTRALAKKLKIQVPEEVERFFAAAEARRWEEVKGLFESLSQRRRSGDSPPEVAALWGPILETFGVAEAAHDWPPQKLLDYGQAILGSLRPGMVYVGGTDPGRFIPTLLNETSDGERHIVVTQNGLADATYLQYVSFLYGEQMATLTQDDSQRAFQEYLTDAQKRVTHDQQFPNEPKQVQPGEDVRITDNRVQVSGQVAVMAINEKLLQMLMDKNPDLSFALEESFPLKSTYPNATLLGPIMELRAQAPQQAYTSELAAQAVDYWRATAEQLLADPEAPDGSDPRKTYAKMAIAQANLLAEHQYLAEAEQACRLALEISPQCPEAAYRLAQLLTQTGRADEARQILDTFARSNPSQASDPLWKAVFSTTPPPNR